MGVIATGVLRKLAGSETGVIAAVELRVLVLGVVVAVVLGRKTGLSGAGV